MQAEYSALDRWLLDNDFGLNIQYLSGKNSSGCVETTLLAGQGTGLLPSHLIEGLNPGRGLGTDLIGVTAATDETHQATFDLPPWRGICPCG
ncbi:MAG TPA: hypothetical protein VH593_17350 [Ktedonobacteraceae bacterium]